ncbi:hypothetical protein TOK_6140 [Pseudonocardia sp. N23]|nr:hypothetical protein TOK_6140 [Pseudonocardia sp. N23]
MSVRTAHDRTSGADGAPRRQACRARDGQARGERRTATSAAASAAEPVRTGR